MSFRIAFGVVLMVGCHAGGTRSSDEGASNPDAGHGHGSGSGSDCGGTCGDGGTTHAIAFGAPRTYAAGLGGYFLTTADLDGDGVLDLAEAATGNAGGLNEIHVLRGSAGGAFADVTTVTIVSSGEMVAADFTGDGIADIAGIAADGMGPLPDHFLHGQGALQYTVTPWGDGRDFNYHLAAADFDEDGTPELAAAYFNAGFVILKVPGFTVLQDDPAFGADTWQVVTGDFDGDGHQDLVVSGVQTSAVRLYRGDGTGTVTFAGETALPGGRLLVLAALDLDRDGRTDLIATHEGNTATVSYGTATGLGAAQTVTGVSGAARAITAGDFDGDGRLDLVAGNFAFPNGSVDIWRNTAAGFTHALTLDVADGVGWNVVAADFNGDGRPDLAVPGFDAVTIYLAKP